MKIALINDTHWGARNDSPAFIDYFNKFYNEVFFPYLQQNNINTIIHLGDVVDRRKFINHNTAHNFKLNFWDKIDLLNIDTHVIIGNHDTYYKNTNEINALQNLNISFNTKVYTSCETVNFDGLDILFMPWICDANMEDSLQNIDKSTAEIVMGHLEIKGFEMHKGHLNEQGLDKNLFKRFEKVISGHFHKKSDDGQVYYLGCPYQLTWSDYNCPKGFHIFDTATRELTRVPNPAVMFKKFIYDDKKEDYTKKDLSDYENTYVKLFISQKTDSDMFDKLLDRFHNEINAYEINVIEDLSSDINSTVKENILDQGEDTLTFLGNYIDQVDTTLDRTKLKTFAKQLYVEASEQ
ncbi:MAG: Pelagibacter phage [Bacteroidota bacterium]